MSTPTIPLRSLGSTGESVSCLGLGGSHIGSPKVTEKMAVNLIRAAIDGGITFLDNSWDYHKGRSEKLMGKALRGGYRSQAFLMTKFDGRTRKEAEKQIDESLQRLGLDEVDLLQYHEVIRYDDVDRFFGPDGAAEALTAARKAGKARYIGFTGHKDPAIHLYMLATAKKNGYRFDTVQMPLNVMDAHFRSFEEMVIPAAEKMGVAVLGMKSMGGGAILKSGSVSAEECLRYALSLPAAVVITGIDSEDILEQALEIGRGFTRLSADKIEELLARTAQDADRGKYELFKTTSHFDATAQNPSWLGAEPKEVEKLAS